MNRCRSIPGQIIAVGLVVLLGWGCGTRKNQNEAPEGVAPIESDPVSEILGSNSLDSFQFDLIQSKRPRPIRKDYARSIAPGAFQLSADERTYELPEPFHPNADEGRAFLIWKTDRSDLQRIEFFPGKKQGDSILAGGQRPDWDPQNQVWSIAVEKAWGSFDENQAGLRWTTLVLTNQENRQETYSIGLHFVGSLPVIAPRLLSVEHSREGETFDEIFRRNHAEGWVVAREIYENPSHQFLTLWIRGGGTVEFQTGVEKKGWHQAHHETGPERRSYYFRSMVSLPVSEIWVASSGVERVIHPLQRSRDRADGWIALALDAGESLEVSWIARVQSETPRCSLPSPSSNHYEWTEKLHEGKQVIGTITLKRSEHKIERWTYSGYEMTGQWLPEVWVSDEAPDHVQTPQSLLSNHGRTAVIRDAPQPVRVIKKMVGPKEFHCHGIF